MNRAAGLSTAIVFTVVIWAIVIPLMNIVVPLFFQTWNVVSTLAFFGERPSLAELAAQSWKLYVALAVSITGTITIGLIAVVTARRHVRRSNHWIALIVGAAFTVLCFVLNKALGMP